MNSHLYCPHDTPSNIEFRDDLPTLLGNTDAKLELSALTKAVISKLKSRGPTISVFHSTSRKDIKLMKTSNGIDIKFISPYSRYIAVLPFAEKERQAESARLAAESRKRKLCPDSSTNVVRIIF